jgi:hypothetical protein
MVRLNAYSCSVSFCRALASTAWRFSRSETWLATSAVTRNANSATQFCGSAMVNCPTGGKKKKLKHSMATTEATTASMSPHAVAIANTPSRYAKPAVVAFTARTRLHSTVMAAMIARPKPTCASNTLTRTKSSHPTRILSNPPLRKTVARKDPPFRKTRRLEEEDHVARESKLAVTRAVVIHRKIIRVLPSQLGPE